MTLIVENGSGMADAESYASVAAADTRLASLGLTNWSPLNNTEKEQALRRATAYMVQAYRGRWAGVRLTLAQALDWPRYGVKIEQFPVSANIVPTDIANACIDLAFKAAAGDLAPDLAPAIIREKVGPLETEYAANVPQYTQFRSIDMALSNYLIGGGAMARLVRA